MKILRKLYLIQTVSNEERVKQGLERLGKGYFEAHRLNPYNPLSYPFFVLLLALGLLLYGFKGVGKDIFYPFKWN